jgi:predicted outer membrane repeat protein
MTIFFALGLGFCALMIGPAGKAVARDWLVPEQAPTIQAAIDSCVAGDVVVLAPGVYDDCTNFSENVYHIAVLIPGISLRGSTGDPADVILDAGFQGRCLEIRDGSGEMVIEGITMRRGKAVSPFGKGGAVFSIFSDPVFRSCVFDSNQADFGGGAISASYGSLTVEDCVFNGNSTSGIGAAVQVSRAPTTITGCTIYGSTGAGVYYATDGVTIANTIIAQGDGASVMRNLDTDPDPVITCSDFHGNEDDYPEFIADLLDTEGNISADPHFCNPQSGDFHLYAVSPCTAENAADCGQIGALPAACGYGAVTWIVFPDGSGDYPTIQAAIDAAAVGDTIALADGVFTGDGNRDLDFLGKEITVKGLGGDPQLVTIDCEGTPTDPHRAFHFHSGENQYAVLRDVTITGGEMPEDGGAILCESSPLIQNVVFEQNGANRGGAIFVDGGDPLIKDCSFIENRGDARAGGVALFRSEAEITNCLFTANWGYIGSAVFLPDSSTVVIEGCTITANNSSVDKDCVGVDGNSHLTIRNSLVTFNTRKAVRNYGAGTVSVRGSNVFGNAEGDYIDAIAGQGSDNGNISADPLYCDAEARVFTLRADSPSNEVNAPNLVQMGVYGVGCQAPTVFADLSDHLPETTGLSGGVSVTDLNGDGFLDFMVANDATGNEIMTGDGAWVFSPVNDPLLQLGPASTVSTAWADFDNDGDQDVYLGNTGLPNILASNVDGVFLNQFTENLGAADTSGASAWADFDGDGFLDLFVASLDSSSVLLKGDGAGGFTEVTSEALTGLTGVMTAAWADYDNDGDQDLFLVKDGLPDQLLKNDDEFVDLTSSPLNSDGAGRGAAWGDYDNDGLLDLYLTRDGEPNRLLRNRGNGNFNDVTSGPTGDPGPGRSGIWGDWDNDGDLDLFLTSCGQSDALLRNDGNANFINVADDVFAQPDSSTGAAWGDFDGDGDLDLVIATRGGRTRLRRNDQASGNNWLRLSLVSKEGRTGCPGARVKVTTPGDSVQIRETGSGGGWLSLSEATVHVGLGQAAVVEKLEVTWPGGLTHEETDLAVNQILTWTEPDSVTQVTPVDDLPVVRFGLRPAHPNPFNPATALTYEVPRKQKVSLSVYDVRGRLVYRLVDEVREQGAHTAIWRGQDDRGRPVAAGVYLVRLKSGGQTVTRGVTLIK